MNPGTLCGRPLSRLTLGTVQLGMQYGIANRAGQPTPAQARDIIRCAHAGGINCLDTAIAYGNSEEVIGQALRDLDLRDAFTVVSKIPAMQDLALERDQVPAWMEQQVGGSVERLGLDAPPVYLLHREEDAVHLDALGSLRDRGLVGAAGCSVMTPEATGGILAAGGAQALQVPTNLLDHRFTRPGILEGVARGGVTVFLRSAYLQGLLLMPQERIPPALQAVIPVRSRLEQLGREAGMALAEFALRYALTLPGVASVVIGVETVEQLEENLELCARGALDASLMEAVSETVPDLGDDILMPNRWPTA